MDARRIEEFRRKLQAGTPVRVVNGQVRLDGAPGTKSPASANGGTPAGGAASDAPAPVPEGVVVKPHEWGAEMLYATPAGEKRALTEQLLLSREYPDFMLDIDDDGVLFAHGRIGPTDTLRHAYQVLLEVPPGYGQGVMPRAYLLQPQLRTGAPHVFSDGSLCLDHSGAFTAKSTLVTFLSWVAVWLVLYEGWLENGRGW